MTLMMQYRCLFHGNLSSWLIHSVPWASFREMRAFLVEPDQTILVNAKTREVSILRAQCRPWGRAEWSVECPGDCRAGYNPTLVVGYAADSRADRRW